MPESPVIITDGSLDWASGVDSIKVTTIQSQQNPNGIQRDQLCWLDNGSTRDGGITPRGGWQPRGRIHSGDALYQRGWMYSPTGANPYLMLSIGGVIYRVNIDGGFSVTNITASFPGTLNPPTVEQAYFTQGEEFMVVQAGDNTTLPLFWDGSILRRSNGLAGTPKELPAATAMDYFMGRIFYAQGRLVSGGDIVGNQASGTLNYNFRNSVLRVTENPLAIGGDGFYVATNAGTIRALHHSANIDAALGEGRLFVFTRTAVYALNVPVTRADWIAAGSSNQPLMTVVQLVNGTVSDTSVVPINGDLYYQSLEPGIRSLNQAVRYFQQPGNIQISSNEQRILQFNDRALMHAASGIQFQNRLLQTSLPKQTPQGIVSQAIVPLDFMPISSFNKQKEPVWQGMHEGLQILQLFQGDFGGLERAFAVTVSQAPETKGEIQLWELTGGRTENGDGRITMVVEFPAFTWGKEFSMKKLVGAEIWADSLSGTVDFTLEYRPDGAACWLPWARWKKCSPRNSAENCFNPISYPLTPCLDSYVSTMTVGRPPETCAEAMGRPNNQGYQFQPRLVVHGFVRIRGLLLFAEPMERKTYANLIC